MKRLFIFILFTIYNLYCNAQDLIVLKNADEIEAKVTMINNDEISYKRWRYLEGPTYVISKTEVFYIKYQNGEKEVISYIASKKSNKSHYDHNQNIVPVKFQGYANLGATFDSISGGPSFDLSIGMNIYNYLYIGIATGFHTSFYYYDDYTTDTPMSEMLIGAYIPIGANIKGFFNPKNNFLFFGNASLGGFIGLIDIKKLNGLMFQIGAGFDYRRFTFELGYLLLYPTSYYKIPLEILPSRFIIAHGGYMRIGIRFGQ